MNITPNKILKFCNILYISSNDKICKKTTTVLKLFFKKIIFRDTFEKSFIALNNLNIHLIITEIDFNDFDGTYLIKEIRKTYPLIPIIVLTENKKTEILLDVIKLNLTDYLLKPTDVNKLISALNRSAKKIYNSGEIVTKIDEDNIYNYLEKKLIQNGKEIILTRKESLLFELLLSNKNIIVKTDDIKKYIWIDKSISESAFKTMFSRLSKKIGKNIITNSFGVGYGIYIA